MSKVYFYDKETKVIKRKNGLAIKKFIVYEIENKGSLDIAERKVKTFACRLGRELAGGFFVERTAGCKPYNFKKDYMVVKVPYSTRARAYDKKDKYIIALIEAEG